MEIPTLEKPVVVEIAKRGEKIIEKKLVYSEQEIDLARLEALKKDLEDQKVKELARLDQEILEVIEKVQDIKTLISGKKATNNKQ